MDPARWVSFLLMAAVGWVGLIVSLVGANGPGAVFCLIMSAVGSAILAFHLDEAPPLFRQDLISARSRTLRQFFDARQKRLSMWLTDAPGLRPIRGALGPSRVRGRARVLEPVEGDDPRLCAAVEAKLDVGPSGRLRVVEHVRVGRFAIEDESGSALIDHDQIELCLASIGERTSARRWRVALRDGDAVEVIGFVQTFPGQGAGADAAGTGADGYRAAPRALTITAPEGQHVMVLARPASSG